VLRWTVALITPITFVAYGTRSFQFTKDGECPSSNIIFSLDPFVFPSLIHKTRFRLYPPLYTRSRASLMILCVCMYGHNLFIISPNATPWSLAMYQKFTVSTVYDSSFVTFTILCFCAPTIFFFFSQFVFIQKENKIEPNQLYIQNIFPFDPIKTFKSR
jgi:hypothetical protein